VRPSVPRRLFIWTTGVWVIQGGVSETCNRLNRGIYQTRPYDIILFVPELGPDGRCLVGMEGTESKMPVINPNVQTVPLPQAQK
jgi:hypothetical protein